MSDEAGRWFCGLAVPFDEPSRDGNLSFDEVDFRRFVELETGLPVKWQHTVLADNHGIVTTVGTARRFALVAEGSTPAGLLALGCLDDTRFTAGMLDGMRRRQITGLSLGVTYVREHDVRIAWPSELSLCFEPRFERARIIDTGAAALSAWELLTGDVVTVEDAARAW